MRIFSRNLSGTIRGNCFQNLLLSRVLTESGVGEKLPEISPAPAEFNGCPFQTGAGVREHFADAGVIVLHHDEDGSETVRGDVEGIRPAHEPLIRLLRGLPFGLDVAQDTEFLSPGVPGFHMHAAASGIAGAGIAPDAAHEEGLAFFEGNARPVGEAAHMAVAAQLQERLGNAAHVHGAWTFKLIQ